MKKFTALFLLIFALVLNANAASPKETQNHKKYTPPILLKGLETNYQSKSLQNSKDNSPQAADFKVFVRNTNWNHSFTVESTPFFLEPTSNNLFYIGTGVQTDANNSMISTTDTLYMFDNVSGKITKANFINAAASKMLIYPSLGVVSTGTDINSSNLGILYTELKSVNGNLNFAGGILNLRLDGDGVVEPITKPQVNNSPAQTLFYTAGPIVTDVRNGRQNIHVVKSLNATASADFGYYGYFGFDFNQINYTSNIVPTQWYSTIFRPDPTGNGSYNSKINLDVDVDGNLYAAVNNMFVDDIENRVFAFSKSTDNGKTWTNFSRISNDLLTNYATSEGFETFRYSAGLAYGQNGFVVTGNDEMSYFCNVFLSNASNEASYQLIEIFYKSGNFGVRKVADLGSSDWIEVDQSITLMPLTVEYSVVGNELKAKLHENNRGHEIEVARTINDNKIIVKYIRNRDVKVPIQTSGAPFPILRDIKADGGEVVQDSVSMMDSLEATDIYLAYRDKDGSSWTVRNSTDDIDNDIFTSMPYWQESINKVYVAKHQDGFPSAFPTFPTMLSQKATGIAGNIELAAIDLSKVGVEESTPASYNFNLYDVAPNPVSSSTNFSYSLNVASNVNLEVYDLMGNKVATVFNGFLAEGFYATPFNVENLSNGSYFYSLSVDGVKLTKTFNVVK